jgi:hypothetical protein
MVLSRNSTFYSSNALSLSVSLSTCISLRCISETACSWFAIFFLHSYSFLCSLSLYIFICSWRSFSVLDFSSYTLSKASLRPTSMACSSALSSSDALSLISNWSLSLRKSYFSSLSWFSRCLCYSVCRAFWSSSSLVMERLKNSAASAVALAMKFSMISCRLGPGGPCSIKYYWNCLKS